MATKAPTIDDTSTEITYQINLDTPGQFYEFTVDVENSGSIDAMLDEVLSTTLTSEQQRYLSYSVTYDSGATITKNDKLNAGASEKVKVRIEFKKDITAEDLPRNNTSLELTLKMRYIQADDNAHEIEDPDDPNKPDEPNNPDNPDNPSKPDEPTNPDEPNNQENPNNSGNQEQSGNQNKPGKTDNSNQNNSSGIDKANGGESSGKSEDTNGTAKNNSTSILGTVRTGDYIVVYLALFALTAVILIIAMSKKNNDNKTV